MKRLWIMLFLLSLSLTYADMGNIHIDVEGVRVIYAGEAWEAVISIHEASAGEQVTVILLNGLRTLHTELTLGTGGIARWIIPAGEITQAGQSLFIVQYQSAEVRYPLQVMPKATAEADLFTTSNNLLAYGGASATIMLLPRDEWGNAAAPHETFDLKSRYPDGYEASYAFDYDGAIGWLILPSHGEPGRVRLSTVLDTSLEITQVSGEPHSITLEIEPPCVPADGRDVIALIATVRDTHHQAVVDGTLVTFIWHDGQGRAQTIDGRAVLRLPAPTQIEWRTYQAVVSTVSSSPAVLEVGCD